CENKYANLETYGSVTAQGVSIVKGRSELNTVRNIILAWAAVVAVAVGVLIAQDGAASGDPMMTMVSQQTSVAEAQAAQPTGAEAAQAPAALLAQADGAAEATEPVSAPEVVDDQLHL